MVTKPTTAKQREMLAVTGNDTERRLVADIERITKERDELVVTCQQRGNDVTGEREERAKDWAKLEQAEVLLRRVDDEDHIKCHCNAHLDLRTFLEKKP